MAQASTKRSRRRLVRQGTAHLARAASSALPKLTPNLHRAIEFDSNFAGRPVGLFELRTREIDVTNLPPTSTEELRTDRA